MSVLSLIKPKAPIGIGWNDITHIMPTLDNFGYPYRVWQNVAAEIICISAVEVVTEDGQPDLGPEYHLSISHCRRRIDSVGAKWVLKQFELEDAKEDNHVPGGVARHFWRPVADKLSGYECACQATEPKVVEDRGDFIWRPAP